MLAVLACAAVLAQDDWNAKIPEKDWPVFQGHRPVAPPSQGPVRYWFYSFPSGFQDVVTRARLDLTKKGYQEYASRELNSGNVVLAKGPTVLITIMVMDDSYSITRNKRISMLDPKKDPWGRMETAKGWVTVVRAETAGRSTGLTDFAAGLGKKGK